MSRPQKMHKPLKGNFTDIINAIADGKGVKHPLRARNAPVKPSVPLKTAPKPPTPKKRDA
jgi:hypothetical protein